MAARLTLATFAPHVGAPFRVRLADGGEAELVLESVEDHAERDPGRPGGLPPPFALLFRAPPGVVLRSGMHELASEALGVLPLGLTPVVTVDAAKGILHEAVFN